jgi:hypothetical protein
VINPSVVVQAAAPAVSNGPDGEEDAPPHEGDLEDDED